MDKKTRVKEKMEKGEYLPKTEYETARKAKLESKGITKKPEGEKKKLKKEENIHMH